MFTIITSDVHLTKDKKSLIKECITIMQSVDPLLKRKYLLKIFNEIADKYYDNHFHNFNHAFEVFQMTSHLLQYVDLSIINKKILLIVSICHDINHLGLNNKTLINKPYGSNTALSETYNFVLSNRSNSYDSLNNISSENSINEEVHIINTNCILYKYAKELFGNINFNTIKYILNTVKSLILCTDLSLHSKYLDIINNDDQDLATMIHIIKIADLSHPLRPFNVHLYWVFKLMNEEKNNLMHQNICEIAKDTINFIRLFLKPLVLKFTLKYKKSFQLNTYMLSTLENWGKYIT